MPVGFRRSLICLFVCAAFGVVPSVTKAGPDEIPVKSFENAHDKVDIGDFPDAVDKSEVEFVLKIAPDLHWHKKMKAFAATGFMGEIEVRDDIKQATLRVLVQPFARIELGKDVAVVGTHWDYKFSNMGKFAGHRIVVTWVRD